MKQFFKNIFILCMVVCLMTSTVTPAQAATASSPSHTANIFGYQYTYYASITSTNSSSIMGFAMVNCSSYAPVGYIGAQVTIYPADDPTLIFSSSDWVFNDTSTTAFSTLTRGLNAGSGYFFARASFAFYNGGSYTGRESDNTPYLAAALPSSMGELVSTLHTAYEEIPGMLAALGQNGLRGYIKAEDIAPPNFTSPEEVIEYMENLPAQRTIPLYASDGITVIDSFLIVNE